jgi:outer membrane protein TolC
MYRALLLSWLVVTGCAKHPDKPEVPVMNQWSVVDRQMTAGDDKNLPYLAWWNDFQDPTLTYLISQGLQVNNTLNKSRGAIAAAQGELKKIQYQWIPTVDVMTGYSRNPINNFPGIVGVIIPSYIINIYQQIKEVKRAKYHLAQIKAEDDALKLTIIAELTASYFTYQAEIERRDLFQTLARDLTELAIIAKKAYQGGLTADIVPQELLSQARIIDGEEEVIEKNIIISRNAIRNLINLNPGEVKRTRQFANLHGNHIIPGSLPLTVLENRPDMQMAANQLRAANESIGIAVSQLLPTLTFDLIDGKAAGNSRYIWPHENVYFNDQLIKTPLIKASALGEIARAKGLDKVSYYNYIDTLQKALRDTTNALSLNDRLSNKLQMTQQAQAHLNNAYKLNRRLYQRGIQNYMDLLKSKIALDQVNITLNEDKLLHLLSIVVLYHELAGGYKVEKSRGHNLLINETHTSA